MVWEYQRVGKAPAPGFSRPERTSSLTGRILKQDGALRRTRRATWQVCSTIHHPRVFRWVCLLWDDCCSGSSASSALYNVHFAKPPTQSSIPLSSLAPRICSCLCLHQDFPPHCVFISKPKLFLEAHVTCQPYPAFLSCPWQRHFCSPSRACARGILLRIWEPFTRTVCSLRAHVMYDSSLKLRSTSSHASESWDRKELRKYVWSGICTILDNHKLNPTQIKLFFKGRTWVAINLKIGVCMWWVGVCVWGRQREGHTTVTKTIAKWSPSSQINKHFALSGMFRNLGKEPHREPWGGTNLAHQVLLLLINLTFPWVSEYY